VSQPIPSTASSAAENIFDNLPALQTPKILKLRDELELYLSTPRDLRAKNGLLWWFERKHIYPTLYRMATDYLSIPGKSVFSLLCPLLHFLIYLLYI
jgi:hypothetical protein